MSETEKSNGEIASLKDEIEEDEVVDSPPVNETYEQIEEILDKVENYKPVIPDAVTENILESAGFDSASPEVIQIHFKFYYS